MLVFDSFVKVYLSVRSEVASINVIMNTLQYQEAERTIGQLGFESNNN